MAQVFIIINNFMSDKEYQETTDEKIGLKVEVQD
jgi:hypothetical protein